MTARYDLVFVGNASRDEIHTFEGPVQMLFGGGVAFSAMSTVWTGKRVAVVTRLAEADDHELAPLRSAGIDVYPTYVSETTRHVVHHLDADVDKRQVVLRASAGPPTVGELDPIAAAADGSTFLHLAALTDRESSLSLLTEAARRGFSVSVDLQGFVRQADRATGEVLYRPVAAKKEIVAAVERVKLDALEAQFLTGLADPAEAAIEMEGWGARETMITWADGVLVRARGRTWAERFSNRSVEGRTGRGDTAFGAYLACRLEQDVGEALRWAAAVASIKLEKAGLFDAGKEEIRSRMTMRHGNGGTIRT